MNCQEFQDALPDLLYAEAAAETADAALRHRETCDACRAEFESLGATVEALNRWPEAKSSGDDTTWHQWPDLRVRSGARLRRLWAPIVTGAIAAALFFAVLVAARAQVRVEDGRWSLAFADRPAPGPIADERDEFMLLLYQRPAVRDEPSTDTAAIVSEYRAWAAGLRDQGRLRAGEKLDADDGWAIGAIEEERAAGTESFRPGPLVLAGFFIVKADSYDGAADIARTCPHLKYGGRIDVRRIAKLPRNP
jgi:hypothetical protein